MAPLRIGAKLFSRYEEFSSVCEKRYDGMKVNEFPFGNAKK